MLTILHGDDEIAIHKELSRQIADANARGVQVVRVDAKGLTLPILESMLGTQELFATEKVLIIDRLHGLLKSKAKDELIQLTADRLQTTDEMMSVILVENKVLTATMLKKFPSANAKVFKLPMLLFSFVDSLGMQPPARLITSFHQVIQTQDAEFVFAMLMRQVRMLVAYISDGSYSGAPFGRAKIATQSSKFSLERILALHSQLLAIDIGQKTSRSALSLTQEIDLFLFGI